MDESQAATPGEFIPPPDATRTVRLFRVADNSGMVLPCGHLRVYRDQSGRGYCRFAPDSGRPSPRTAEDSHRNSPARPEYQGESDDQHHSEQTNPNHIPTHIPTLHAISVHGTSS